jgi:hypothetical protein
MIARFGIDELDIDLKRLRAANAMVSVDLDDLPSPSSRRRRATRAPGFGGLVVVSGYASVDLDLLRNGGSVDSQIAIHAEEVAKERQLWRGATGLPS